MPHILRHQDAGPLLRPVRLGPSDCLLKRASDSTLTLSFPHGMRPGDGVPIEVPAHLVLRVYGTSIEVLCQAADAMSPGRARLALCVGSESMRCNPIAYPHRGGFRLRQVEFKDLTL